MKPYHEIEEKHCILKIQQEREKLGGFDVYKPKIRANASLKSVAEHARLMADLACQEYRITSDRCREYDKAGQGGFGHGLRLSHKADKLRAKWQTLEEIAQHLERLT